MDGYDMNSSGRVSKILDAVTLAMWAAAFLFLLNGERYRYYLGPMFWSILIVGFVLAAFMSIALGRSEIHGRTGSWIGSTFRAFVLLTPLIYGTITGGSVLDSQAFSKRWMGTQMVGESSTAGDRPIHDIDKEINDDEELIEAYKSSSPKQIPRAFRKVLGLKPGSESPVKSVQDGIKGGIEVDLLDLVEFADRYKGRRVITEGMVAWDKNDRNRFYLFRFVIWCCIADAQPAAVLVEYTTREKPKENKWVRVEGSADLTEVDGQTGVIIRNALASSIPIPKDPYLY